MYTYVVFVCMSIAVCACVCVCERRVGDGLCPASSSPSDTAVPVCLVSAHAPFLGMRDIQPLLPLPARPPWAAAAFVLRGRRRWCSLLVFLKNWPVFVLKMSEDPFFSLFSPLWSIGCLHHRLLLGSVFLSQVPEPGPWGRGQVWAPLW